MLAYEVLLSEYEDSVCLKVAARARRLAFIAMYPQQTHEDRLLRMQVLLKLLSTGGAAMES